jgi:hypothetical protein
VPSYPLEPPRLAERTCLSQVARKATGQEAPARPAADGVQPLSAALRDNQEPARLAKGAYVAPAPAAADAGRRRKKKPAAPGSSGSGKKVKKVEKPRASAPAGGGGAGSME